MKELFKELPENHLTSIDRERIMKRVHRAAHRREVIAEWCWGIVIVAISIFALVRMLPKPEFEMPQIEIRPLYLIVAGCVAVLLMVNELVTRSTIRRHRSVHRTAMQI